MAYLLGPANKILDIGLDIKRAADDAKRHERECRRVERTVGRICGLIQMIGMSQAHVTMLQHPIIGDILDNVVDSLEEALALMVKCKKKKTVVQFVTARGTAKKLRWVQEELLRKESLCTSMINTMTTVANGDMWARMQWRS